MKSVIPLVDGECYLVEHFVEKTRADEFFHDIRQHAVWHQPRIRLFGKTVNSPRLAAWYGDPQAVYAYSGLVNRPLPWFRSLAPTARPHPSLQRREFQQRAAQFIPRWQRRHELAFGR